MKMSDYGISLEIGYSIDGNDSSIIYNLMNDKSEDISWLNNKTVIYITLRWMGFRVIICMNRQQPDFWVNTWPVYNKEQGVVARNLPGVEKITTYTTSLDLAQRILIATEMAAKNKLKKPQRVHRILQEFYSLVPTLYTRSPSELLNQE